MKLMQTRTSVAPEDYAQARRDYPDYALLCDCEDALKAAKEALTNVTLTGCLEAHRAINAAMDAVSKRREELEKGIYPGTEYPLDMSALFAEGGAS